MLALWMAWIFLRPCLLGVVEGEFGDAGGAFFGDDFERLRDAGDDHDFEAGVEVFGVFADDDEVDAGVFGVEAGEVL